MKYTLISIVLAATAGAALAQSGELDYSWRYYRPGNTGVMGDFSDAIWIAPDGTPYIGGYDPFFEEGGFSRYIEAENRWENFSNVDYPVMGSSESRVPRGSAISARMTPARSGWAPGVELVLRSGRGARLVRAV